jgi:hypothetical protein
LNPTNCSPVILFQKLFESFALQQGVRFKTEAEENKGKKNLLNNASNLQPSETSGDGVKRRRRRVHKLHKIVGNNGHSTKMKRKTTTRLLAKQLLLHRTRNNECGQKFEKFLSFRVQSLHDNGESAAPEIFVVLSSVVQIEKQVGVERPSFGLNGGHDSFCLLHLNIGLGTFVGSRVNVDGFGQRRSRTRQYRRVKVLAVPPKTRTHASRRSPDCWTSPEKKKKRSMLLFSPSFVGFFSPSGIAADQTSKTRTNHSKLCRIDSQIGFRPRENSSLDPVNVLASFSSKPF